MRLLDELAMDYAEALFAWAQEWTKQQEGWR